MREDNNNNTKGSSPSGVPANPKRKKEKNKE